MENTYFKIIGQKSGNNKVILVAVVEEDFMRCEVPSIFEVQGINQAPTIYSGTYPNVRINIETIKNRDDLKGLGINGILTNESWYCAKRTDEDVFNITLLNQGAFEKTKHM